MEDEELDDLTDEQFCALDQAVLKHVDGNSIIQTESVNIQNTVTQTPADLATDILDNLSEDQLVALDHNVLQNVGHQNNQNGNENNAVNELKRQIQSDPVDHFVEITDEQYADLDQAIQNFDLNQHENNEHEASTVSASQLELASAVFEDDDSEPSLEHLECLRSRFGHNQFREKQWEIIHTIMNEKRDVCAVMATGYGKSLCFQFPAVYKNSMVLVISPLIALMQAQVLSLNESKIRACLVGSAQPDKQIVSRIQQGQFNIIYSSPEFLQGYQGRTMLNALKDRLTLIAIDESHCVSAWGLDFRPDFRRLNVIRSVIPDTPILALTATATAQVRYDIKSSLGLQNPREILTSFDRPNLEFIVHEKSSVWGDLRKWVTNISGSVIVYVLKRTEAEEIAEELLLHGVKCQPYHAGMEIGHRKSVLEEFLNDELKVIVATIAFGMGIDKKDIRTIVHYGASKNLESYYQEVGRAGRDGLPSKVVTFFEIEDFNLHDWFLEKENTEKKLSNFVKKFLRNLALHIREFVYSTKCRRKMILEYFGEDSSSLSIRNDCCDNCAKGLSSWMLTDLYVGIDGQGKYNFAKDAEILFNAIESMESKAIPTGRERIFRFLPDRQPYYWCALLDQLMLADFIDFIPGKTYVTLGQKAHFWRNKSPPRTLKLKPAGAIYKFFARKPSTPFSNVRWSSHSHNHESVVSSNVCDLFFGQCVFCG